MFHSDENGTPTVLYKYAPESVIKHVLENKTLKFTPLNSTNDPFEVRFNFENFAGPKFLEMMQAHINEINFEEKMIKLAKEKAVQHGTSKSTRNIKRLMKKKLKTDDISGRMKEYTEIATSNILLPYVNNKDNIRQFVEKIGQEMLCLSLSDRMDISSMWAHYSSNHTGFVVALKANHPWFKSNKKRRITKVRYFDGNLDEILSDSSSLFYSKTTNWSSEREWRLCLSRNDMDEITVFEGQEIFTRKFPSEIVEKIILGHRMNESNINRIIEISQTQYTNVRVYKIETDIMSSRMNEVLIA